MWCKISPVQGGPGCTWRKSPLEEAQIPTPETETIRGTLASCRLDSVIGAGFRLSRTRAGELVLSGGAAVDGLPCQKPDRQVAPGAVISLRGMGENPAG